MKAGVNSKLQKATFTAVKLNGMFSTSLWPFHDGHPFLVVAEQVQVQIGADGVRLRTNRQLGKDSFFGLSCSAILGTDNSLLKSLLNE